MFHCSVEMHADAFAGENQARVFSLLRIEFELVTYLLVNMGDHR
jgi:hypothetical protein